LAHRQFFHSFSLSTDYFLLAAGATFSAFAPAMPFRMPAVFTASFRGDGVKSESPYCGFVRKRLAKGSFSAAACRSMLPIRQNRTSGLATDWPALVGR
jgi:hypothetical protein